MAEAENYAFRRFDCAFDKLDKEIISEDLIVSILLGIKRYGLTPDADYVYRYIRGLQESSVNQTRSNK